MGVLRIGALSFWVLLMGELLPLQGDSARVDMGMFVNGLLSVV